MRPCVIAFATSSGVRFRTDLSIIVLPPWLPVSQQSVSAGTRSASYGGEIKETRGSVQRGFCAGATPISHFVKSRQGGMR
jgi:hypothetical protein